MPTIRELMRRRTSAIDKAVESAVGDTVKPTGGMEYRMRGGERNKPSHLTDEQLRNMPQRKKAVIDRTKIDAANEEFLKRYYGLRHPAVGIKP